MTTSSFRHAVAALAAALVLGACAQETPAINRVQPNYSEKEFFIGKDFKERVFENVWP